MVQAILVLLGLFVLFAVTYNLLSMRKAKSAVHRKTVFTASPKMEVMKPLQEEVNLEPIVDISISPRASKAAPAPVVPMTEKYCGSVQDPEESTLVSIYVMNQPPTALFNPYELIQSLAAAHCHFGEMSIFHRHEQLNGKGDVLFSIAQAIKPGIFNMSDIGSIKCPGLILFMDAAMNDDPYSMFNTMLETAEQLAQDLQAGLFQTATEPMTESSQHYYERKLNYAKKERERLKEMV